MPIENGVGYGEYTGVKIEHLSKILAMHMAIAKSVIKKYASYAVPKYRYVDLTAGRGITPDGNLGSPIVFLNKVNDPKLKFDILFAQILLNMKKKISMNYERQSLLILFMLHHITKTFTFITVNMRMLFRSYLSLEKMLSMALFTLIHQEICLISRHFHICHMCAPKWKSFFTFLLRM